MLITLDLVSPKVDVSASSKMMVCHVQRSSKKGWLSYRDADALRTVKCVNFVNEKQRMETRFWSHESLSLQYLHKLAH